MMGKMEVRTPPGGRPRDGRHCDLCGCSQPAVRCDKCGCQIFCLSCDDMYHRHPKRRFHLRKAVDPIPPVPQARPVLPMKVAHLNTATPGDPSKMPLPPPRKKKSIFGGFRRASPSSDKSSPTLPKKEYSWTDRLGSIKKFMSNRPLPPLPTDEDNDGDSLPTTNGQSPTRGDLTFIHRRSDERPPQLPQRSPKSPDFPPISQERDNRFPNASMQMPGQIRNGTMEPNANHMNQSHDFPTNDENQWNNRFSNQNGPQAFGTLQRHSHKGFMPPGAPGFPGGMHQSSSATDLHNLQNIEGMPGAAPPPPHYPHYPVNPHMPPPHYPYPMYPQYPNYPQYFGHSFANLSNPPTTDGDVSDQSEGTSSRHSSKKHPFRKRAKRSQSVMMDRMQYPGQFPYPGPFGPYPGYGPWGAPMPMETPPSPASSIRSLNRSGRTRRRKKMTSEDDDEEFSLSSSPLSRPKSSSSGHKDSPQRAPLSREASSSEEESDDEMRNRRNKVNTIQRRQSEPMRTSSSPAEETPKKASKHKKKSSSKQSDSETQELPQVRNERRPSNDSITDQPVPQQSPSSPPMLPTPSPTWECRHCTYMNPIGNKICQVCCKSAVPMSESPVGSNSRPPSAATDSPKPTFSSEKASSSAEKFQDAEDDSGKKDKRDMEILNSALDEAEKEISRGLEELMKLKDDIDTSVAKDAKTEDDEKPVYKSSGRMRTSILDKLNLNKPQTSKSTASTSTETQTGQSNWTGDRILEGRRPSNASSASETYNSPTAQSPELERRLPVSMQKRDSSCQTQQDSLAEYLESKKAAEEAYLGRPINNFGFGYGDRMDMMQSPVPSMYDRFFGGGMAGMMQRSHSRASLFSGRINDPLDYGGPGFGYGPAPMYRSISRGSLTGDYPDGRLSEFHNLRKPDFYLSMEELVERRRQDNMRAQGLELVRMIREAEQHGFTADDIQVALTHCGKQSPMEWLQDNWRNMLDSVVTLSTNYGNDKKENDIGVLSENEAREALRLHKGNIWAAVTECVEGRQRKYLELSARGNFSRKDIVDALTSSEGDVEMAYAKLTKSTGKPFLMRIWGDGEGAQNQDGAQPMPENLTDMPQRYQKDDIANSDILSDELWSEDEDVEWEEDEYDEERADFEDLQTCHEDLNSGPQEMRTPESDKSDYIDAFALEDRNFSSPSDDIFFVIPEQKQGKKKGFLGKLAALRKDSKEKVETLPNISKDEISSGQSSQSKGNAMIQGSTTSIEQVKGNGALSALKNTLTAIKDTVTGNSKSDRKLPCAQPEKRTIIVKGQIEHESLSTNSKDSVTLTSVKSLEDDFSKQRSENEPSEELKEADKSSDIKKEASKDIKHTEIKLPPDNQTLETAKTVKSGKEPEKTANNKKEDSKKEKIEDAKPLGDNQMSKNNQSSINKNLSETPSSDQIESQKKMEKKKSQSLSERLKFAKQSQSAKSSANSNGVQEEISIPSTSAVTLSKSEKEISNQERVKNVEEIKNPEIPLQNQIPKETTTATDAKWKEMALGNSSPTVVENRQTQKQQDVMKKKSSQNENKTIAGPSTAKDIDLPPQNESDKTVIHKTVSASQEVLKKIGDSTKTKLKSQERQLESPSANKAEEIVSKEKNISSQNKILPVQPEALQESKEDNSSSKTVKEQENKDTSQFKESVKKSTVAKNKVPKSPLPDNKSTPEKTVTSTNSEIPKPSEKLIQKVQPLKESSSSQVEQSVSVNDGKSSEPSEGGLKESYGLKAEINKNQKQIHETALKIEQKPSVKEIETSNKVDGKIAKVAESLPPQTKLQNLPNSSLNERAVEQQSKEENKQVHTSQDVLKNVENTSLSAELTIPHTNEQKNVENANNALFEEITSGETLKIVENTSNVSPETTPQNILKNVENAKNVSPEILPHDILKNVENTSNVSPEIAPQNILKNVENANTMSSSSEITTPHDILKSLENANSVFPVTTSQDISRNADNVNTSNSSFAITALHDNLSSGSSKETTSHDAFKNVENTNNALPEITTQDILKKIENENTLSPEKAASDEFVSNMAKSAETPNRNQIINAVTENKTENIITTKEVLETTQYDTKSLIKSENQQHTVANVTEKSTPETSIGEIYNENAINFPTTSFQKPAENETEGQISQNSGKEIDMSASVYTEKPESEKSAETQQTSAQTDSKSTVDSDLKESTSTELQNSSKKADVSTSVVDIEKPEPQISAETQQFSAQMDSKPTVESELKESAVAVQGSKEDFTQASILSSVTTVQQKETEENSGPNAEINSQISKENSSEIKAPDQGGEVQNVNNLKDSSSVINDSVKDSSEQWNEDSKSNQSIETPSEIPQSINETSKGNQKISVASTSNEKAPQLKLIKERAKSGKLITEKIERLRRSFSREENDIKLYFKEKSYLKTDKTEPSTTTTLSGSSSTSSSARSSVTSINDIKINFGASSSATEIPVPQNSHRESTEDKKAFDDKAFNEQQVKSHVETGEPHSVAIPESNLQLNESDQLKTSQESNLLSSDHTNEVPGFENASNSSSESAQNTELSNIASTSDSNIISFTSEDSLKVAETSVTPTIEQIPTTPKEEIQNSATDANLQVTSQNEAIQETMNSNQITGAEMNVITAASTSTNDTDISLSTLAEMKADSSSETQQASADANTEAKDVAEAATFSTLPNESEHSNIQDNVSDSPPSSSNQLSRSASIEQILRNISGKLSEKRKSLLDNDESDDTDIQYSEDESRPSSITPPNPIDTLRSRFEGLAGGTSGRGTVRPQSPFRRMSLNSRKQAIALEKIRDTKADKPWYNQKTEPLQPKTYPKRTIKQQLEMERKVRKMVGDRIVATYRKAEIVVQLMDLNFEQEEAIDAANECSTLEQAISYLQQECLLCTGYFPVSQIVSMTHCQHRACWECIRAYFTVQIRDRTILDLLCPFCNQPDIGDEDVAQDYFNHLDIMLKKLVDVEIHELFQRKLRDRVLMKDPNFRWCSQCSSGFISMPNLTRLICPDCNAVTCASCRRLWEREHQGISCEAFAALKDSSDPEAQAAGLAKMLTEDGIECPSCHFKYALAKGGCMHFRCIQCQHDFCSGCSRPFKMGQKCGVSEFCAKLGLHAHHPRNCLFYLRDKEPEDLQKLLDMSDVKYNKDLPDDMELTDTCQVMEQKETADGMMDDYCGKEVQEGYAGLCRVHYVEYLGQLVNKHRVDPIQIFDNDDLELVLRRANIRLPPKRYRESDLQYRIKLVNLIEEDLPLDRIEGS